MRTSGEPALVTVLVPTHESAPIIEQTLASVAAQTDARWALLVADDASYDGTADVCSTWARREPRVRVHRHPQRIGWVANLNWLLERVETEYFCFLPHDDLLAPDFLARLLRELGEQPDAVCAFSDLDRFGAASGTFGQASITGPAGQRFATLLRDHYPAVAFRGVTRTAAVRAGRGCGPTRTVTGSATPCGSLSCSPTAS